MNSISESSEAGSEGNSHEKAAAKRQAQASFNQSTIDELVNESKRRLEEESLGVRGRWSAHEGKTALDDENTSTASEDHGSNSESRKISRISDHEVKVERKKSEIYQQIGKFDFLPFSLNAALEGVKRPDMKLHKESLIDIVLQLLGVHVPLWLSVLALHVTLVEIFNMKLYYQYYYHHPAMKLIALLIAVSVGIFHELRWTWLVNNVLGIASAYTIIARLQPFSYLAGLMFLVGMVIFDLFWMYGIDLFSTVTKDTRSPIMIVFPWGKEGRREMLAVLDIIVPGIFLDILLKFAEMYDGHAFYPAYYATVAGLIATFVISTKRGKSTPAMVIPALSAILVSLSSVERPMDLLRFEIKH